MNVEIKRIFYFMLAAAIIISALPAFASLVPTTFGFPVIVQNGSTSAFNQDTATATDFENLSLKIPAFSNDLQLGGIAMTGPNGGNIGSDQTQADNLKTVNVLPFGPVDLAFPSIHQDSLQVQNVTHTDFAQTNEFAEFAYPFVAAGPVSLPGFGFEW